MSKIDKGYKIAYIFVSFLILTHTYFMFFFSENKIRLTAKFRSKKWQQQLKTQSFDKILYLKEVPKNLSCPSEYTEYKDSLHWPGTQKGFQFNEFKHNYPCSLTLNKNDTLNFPDLKNYYNITSIFNPILGEQNCFIEYKINILYDELCHNDNSSKCVCDELLSSEEDFKNRYPGLNLNNNFDFRNRKYELIEEIPKQNLNIFENKKLCKKDVINFTVLYKNKNNNNNNDCIGGIKCANDTICIFNEKECPNYLNLTIVKEMGKGENLTKKLGNVLISSLDLNYNNVPCSVLDNKTNYRSFSESLPKDFNYPLIKKNTFSDIPKCHEITSEQNDTREDIIHLGKLDLKNFYEKANIFNITSKLNDFEEYVSGEDKIFLTATTYFSLNFSGECPMDVLQIVNETKNQGSNISKFNFQNYWFIDYVFILGFLYLCYKHFSVLRKINEPEYKFYYVKHFVGITILMFAVYFWLFFGKFVGEEDRLEDLFDKIDIINENKCFSRERYLKYLLKIKDRLEDFYLLDKQIYHELFIENVTFIILILSTSLAKVPFKRLISFKDQKI